MAERLNAAVSKTVVRLKADRGFESPSLRKFFAKPMKPLKTIRFWWFFCLSERLSKRSDLSEGETEGLKDWETEGLGDYERGRLVQMKLAQFFE